MVFDVLRLQEKDYRARAAQGPPEAMASLSNGTAAKARPANAYPCPRIVRARMGHPRPEHRRYGCGFHRDKGPRVCPNGLSVRVGTVEARLVATLRECVLQPAEENARRFYRATGAAKGAEMLDSPPL